MIMSMTVAAALMPTPAPLTAGKASGAGRGLPAGPGPPLYGGGWLCLGGWEEYS